MKVVQKAMLRAFYITFILYYVTTYLYGSQMICLVATAQYRFDCILLFTTPNRVDSEYMTYPKCDNNPGSTLFAISLMVYVRTEGLKTSTD